MATLYAAIGGSVNSDLYTIDPATGAETSVGATGFAITGLAFDPTSGVLYGITSNLSPSNPRSLITVDPATGAGTFIGALGIGLADISFALNGTLYGMTTSTTRLVTINKSTGTATVVGFVGVGGSGGNATELDASNGVLAFLDGANGDFYVVNTTDGSGADVGPLSGNPFVGGGFPPITSASFGPFGLLYAWVSNFTNTHLVTISSSGAMSDRGLNVNLFDAIAWRGVTKPSLFAPVFRTLFAKDDRNPSSSFSSLSGNYVKAGSTLQQFSNIGAPDNFSSMGDAHPTFYIRGVRLPPDGRYVFDVSVRGNTNGGSGRSWLIVRRNGMEMFQTPLIDNTGGTPDVYVSLNGAPVNTGAGGGPTSYPVVENDVYDFTIFDNSSNFAIEKIRVRSLQLGGVGDTQVPMLQVPKVVGAATPTLADLRLNPAPLTGSTSVDTYDMCITADGKVWVVFVERHNTTPGTMQMVVKMWDGSSWTLITNDLWGRGVFATNNSPWVGCESHGNDVFFLFGDWTIGITGHPATQNDCWRVKKYSAGVFTELGTGQRAINPRSSQGADIANDARVPTLAVSPAGVPFVAWGENEDGLFNYFPYCWYWNGSAWVDTAPIVPVTNNYGATELWEIYVTTDVRAIGMCFRDHTGAATDWPSLVFPYQDGTGAGEPLGHTRQGLQYQEFNGTSWGNTLDFTTGEVWSGLYFPEPITWAIEHWTEGLSLFDYEGKVWLSASLGFGTSGGAQGVLASLKADGSAFEPPPSGQFYDRLGWSNIPRGVLLSNSYGLPAVDSEGNLWMVISLAGIDADGPLVIGKREIGTGDGWTSAHYDPVSGGLGGPDLPLNGDFGGFAQDTLRFNGTTGYMISSLSEGQFVLYSFPRDAPYTIWRIGARGHFDGAPIHRSE